MYAWSKYHEREPCKALLREVRVDCRWRAMVVRSAIAYAQMDFLQVLLAEKCIHFELDILWNIRSCLGFDLLFLSSELKLA